MTAPMTTMVDRIAKAVLYEGYLLYPYRSSAIKNRQRFNFGVIYPQAYSAAQGGGHACTMQTECLVVCGPAAVCEVQVKFLHIVTRFEERISGEAMAEPWQEAVEERIEVPEFDLLSLAEQPMQCPFRISASKESTSVKDATGKLLGETRR